MIACTLGAACAVLSTASCWKGKGNADLSIFPCAGETPDQQSAQPERGCSPPACGEAAAAQGLPAAVKQGSCSCDEACTAQQQQTQAARSAAVKSEPGQSVPQAEQMQPATAAAAPGYAGMLREEGSARSAQQAPVKPELESCSSPEVELVLDTRPSHKRSADAASLGPPANRWAAFLLLSV